VVYCLNRLSEVVTVASMMPLVLTKMKFYTHVSWTSSWRR